LISISQYLKYVISTFGNRKKQILIITDLDVSDKIFYEVGTNPL